MRFITLFLCHLLISFQPVLAQQNFRVSPDLPPFGDASNLFAISPDSQWIVTGADTTLDGRGDFFSARFDRSQNPVRITPEPVEGGQFFAGFRIDPSSTRLVYLADQETDEAVEIFSVPLDASSPPVKLNRDLLPDQRITSQYVMTDNQEVLYISRELDPDHSELFIAPIDGSTESTRLSQDLPSGSNIFSLIGVDNAQRRAIYFGTPRQPGVEDVLSVDIDLPGDTINLTEQINLPGQDISIFPGFLTDTYVVFEASGIGVPTEVYSAPIDGSSLAVQLSDFSDLGFTIVNSSQISASGNEVLFVASQNNSDYLFIAPIDGSSPASMVVSADEILGPNSSFGFMQLTSDSSRLVFTLFGSGERNLYSLRLSEGSAPTLLNPESNSSFSSLRNISITEDNTRVVYITNQFDTQRNELFYVPIDGGQSILLNEPLQGNNDVITYRLSPNSSSIAYLANQTGEAIEAYQVTFDSNTRPRRLNGNLVDGGNVFDDGLFFSSFALDYTPDNEFFIYWADQDTNGQFEVYATKLLPDPSSVPAFSNWSLFLLIVIISLFTYYLLKRDRKLGHPFLILIVPHLCQPDEI